MTCQEFRRLIDSYLGDELLVETNHSVLKHLENCGDCREQLGSRRKLRERLNYAVRSMPELQMRGEFVAALRTRLEANALRPSVWGRLISGSEFAWFRVTAIAAACLIVIGIGALFLVRPPTATNLTGTDLRSDQGETNRETNTNSLADATRVSWKSLSAEAVGDHKDCAVKFNLPDYPITLDEAAEKFDAINKDIDKAVFDAAKKAFDKNSARHIELLEAHSCIYGGRRFTHIVMRREKNIISVLMTDNDLAGESEALFSEQSDGVLNVAAFSVGRHLFFVISELDAADNSLIAHEIYPAMFRHIGTAGA